MEDTKESRGMTRREFFKQSGLLFGGLIGGWIGIKELLGSSDEKKNAAPTTKTPPPTFVPPSPTAAPAEVKAPVEPKKGVEEKTESIEVGIVTEAETKDLANIFARHWVAANNLPEKSVGANEKLFARSAREALLFAWEVRELLKDPANKARLTNLARFTDVGEVKFPFRSPFFGPQELRNLKSSRLVKLNLALPITIGIIENTSNSRLFSRLSGRGDETLPEMVSPWLILEWDAFNAHAGLDAGRILTETEENYADYGHNSRGEILAIHGEKWSLYPEDRLRVMFQPLILALRCFRTSKGNGVTNFEVGPQLLRRYNGTDKWQKRYSEINKGLQEFCQKYPRYNWIFTESIV